MRGVLRSRNNVIADSKLAARFGKTSRRWARNRMAEAIEGVAPAMADVR